jgi:hypothetical protein
MGARIPLPTLNPQATVFWAPHRRSPLQWDARCKRPNIGLYYLENRWVGGEVVRVMRGESAPLTVTFTGTPGATVHHNMMTALGLAESLTSISRSSSSNSLVLLLGQYVTWTSNNVNA